MTRNEAAAVVGIVQALYPHIEQPATAPDLWAQFLAAVPATEVEQAVREWVGRGERFPPGVPDVVATLSKRQIDPPDWDEARAEILRAIRTYRAPSKNPDGSPRIVASQRDLYPPPPDEWWSHPLLAAFISGAWDEWRMAATNDGTFNAQQRNAYLAMRDRDVRSVALRSVGAPRREGLRRLDPAALITDGTA